MTALYSNRNNYLSGRYETEDVSVRFDAFRDGGSINLSVEVLDGTLELSDLRSLCQIVRMHIPGLLAWYIKFGNLRIVVPPLGSLSDRLSVCGFGIGGFTLDQILELSNQMGICYVQPTPNGSRPQLPIPSP